MDEQITEKESLNYKVMELSRDNVASITTNLTQFLRCHRWNKFSWKDTLSCENPRILLSDYVIHISFCNFACRLSSFADVVFTHVLVIETCRFRIGPLITLIGCYNWGRSTYGNSRDGECFNLDKQTWRRKSNGTQKTISQNLLIKILWYLAEFLLLSYFE